MLVCTYTMTIYHSVDECGTILYCTIDLIISIISLCIVLMITLLQQLSRNAFRFQRDHCRVVNIHAAYVFQQLCICQTSLHFISCVANSNNSDRLHHTHSRANQSYALSTSCSGVQNYCLLSLAIHGKFTLYDLNPPAFCHKRKPVKQPLVISYQPGIQCSSQERNFIALTENKSSILAI